MSTAVFPTLAGLGWSVQRTVEYQTRRQTSVSGKEVTIAEWSIPRYSWEVMFNVLRQWTVNGDTQTEMATLFAFYSTRLGGFDSFLYQDVADFSVTDQGLGSGNGSNLIFPLLRGFGGYTSPVLAPQAGTYTVKVATSTINPANYTVYPWGTAAPNFPGQLVFNPGQAPGNGALVTISMQYYWPCRFVEDKCVFENFLSGRWRVKKLTFQSQK